MVRLYSTMSESQREGSEPEGWKCLPGCSLSRLVADAGCHLGPWLGLLAETLIFCLSTWPAWLAHGVMARFQG